jgi:broad specificity phosphatase PhoE
VSLDILIVQHAEKESAPGDPGLTSLGHDQARTCGTNLAATGPVDELWSSPLRRAVETAGQVAAAFGLHATAIRQDDRVRERINWPGEPHQSREAFLRDWVHSTAHRDLQPAWGDSSRAAGARFAAFLDERRERLTDGRLIVVAHGGVTVDLIRTLFGDNLVRSLAPGVFEHGIPPCGITRITLAGDRRALLGIGEHAEARMDHG